MPTLSFRFIIALLLVSNSFIALAQETKERPKESDIHLEKLFIEATREKILENYDDAIKKYLEVIQHENQNAVANYELAKLYEEQKELDKAVIKAERAAELEPQSLLFVEQYALILEKTGDLKKASELYANLVDEYPTQEHLYYKQAYFLTKSNKADQAIKVYNTLEKKVGVKEPISMRKYKLYMGMGKSKKGGQELEKLLKAFPGEPEYMLRLANYSATIKQYEAANDWYKKVLEVDPQNPTANVALVEYFLQSGDTTRYLNALAPIFEDQTQSIAAKLKTLEPLTVGLLEGKYAKYKTEIETLSNNLVMAHPDNTSANLMQAELLYQDKKYTAALEKYEAATQKEKNNSLLWQRLLDCLYRTNNRAKLLKYSEEMLDLYPSQPQGYYYNGIAQLEIQNYKKAADQFSAAVDIAVTDPVLQAKALSYLGQSYVLLNSNSKAEKAFKEALEKMPQNSEIKEVYAYSLALQGSDLTKAMTMIDEAIETNQNNPDFYTTKGFILYKQSKYTLAEQLLNKAINLGGSEMPKTLEHCGDTAFQLGKIDEAVRFWQKALDKGSSSAVLKRKISTKQLYE